MTERPDPHADGAAVPPAGPAVPDDPWSADALLDRLVHGADDGAAAGSTPALAGLVQALRGPATADELAGESTAVAAFLAAVELGPGGPVTSPTHDRPRSRRRPAVLSTLLASKLAFAAAAASAVTLGGTAAAAYTGSLPTPLQRVASQTIGAPEPEETVVAAADVATPEETESSDPEQTPEQTETSDPTLTATDTPTPEATGEATDDAKGPDATGPAAFGLCTAFLHGGLHNSSSVAYQALVAAANGATATATPTETATDGSTATETATTDPAPAETTAAADDDAVKTYCEGVLGTRATAKASAAAEHGKSGEHGRPEATESAEPQDQQESDESSSHGRPSTAGEHGKSGDHPGNGSEHQGGRD